jgi:hypothetical protein
MRAGERLDRHINPMQGQIIQQIMAQYYAGPEVPPACPAAATPARGGGSRPSFGRHRGLTAMLASPLQAQNQVIISLLAECSAAMSAEDVDHSRTHCPAVWDTCVAQLEKNAKGMSKALPEWLRAKPTGKADL